MDDPRSNFPDEFRALKKRREIFLEGNSEVFIPLTCSLCNDIMLDPVQTECGCRFCLECIGASYDRECTICPNCNYKDIKRQLLLEDRAVEREMLRMNIYCINNSCKETIQLSKLANHLEKCENRIEESSKFQLRYHHQHKPLQMMEYCINGMKICSDCGKEMSREDKVYKNVTESLNEKCSLSGCDLDGFVNLITSEDTIKCPLKCIECQDRWLSDQQVRIIKGIQNLREENKIIRESYLKNEISRAEEILDLQIENSKNLDTLNCLVQKIDIISQHADSLLREMKRSWAKDSRDIVEPSKEIICQHGQATWTIQNIRKLIEETNLGNIKQVLSKSFYITRHGYNMSFKIYPNGDGRARDRYLSAFFVITKGEYDNQLLWPFQSRVTLSLLSSNLGAADINVHMKPDQNPACYGKPENRYNVAAGQPELVKISKIMDGLGYIHKGDLKLRISVHADTQ